MTDVGKLFDDLEKHGHSTTHPMEYTRILDLIRSTKDLDSLDLALFNEIKADTFQKQGSRDKFYVCNALTQLIESVYADCDLEQNHNHPHIKGWMVVVISWAGQEPFKEMWKLSRKTYASRFQQFYDDRLAI